MISLKAQTVTGFMNTVNPVKKSPASVKANDFWPPGLYWRLGSLCSRSSLYYRIYSNFLLE